MRTIAIVLVAAACTGNPKPGGATAAHHGAERPLYDRLGGRDGIASIVKDFVEVHVVKDKRISARFASVNPADFEDKLTAQLCEITGGPCKYTGKPMREAHASLSITDAELAAFVDDLAASLAEQKVGAAEQKELIAKVQDMREDIVTK